MNQHPVDIAQDWIDAVRLRIGALPESPDQHDIESLRERLTAVPWLGGCPSVHSAHFADLPRHYRRHLIADEPAHHYTALLIAWPQGHRTPLHDHEDLWGIELVIEGALAIEEFARSGTPEDPVLAHERTLILGIGDATAFTGPGYVHSCRNLSAHKPALSLHVYGGALDTYSTFRTHMLGRYTTTRLRANIDSVLV